MMLPPSACCTLKVSVTTRWPLMKTPKEPESIVWPGAGLDLSFLSLSEAPSAVRPATRPGNEAASKSNTAQRIPGIIPVVSFTRSLLLPCVLRCFSGAKRRRFPQRSRPRCGRTFQYATRPSSKNFGEPRRVRENSQRTSAPDAPQPLLAFPVHDIAAIVPRPARPETPWERPRPAPPPHLPPARP